MTLFKLILKNLGVIVLSIIVFVPGSLVQNTILTIFNYQNIACIISCILRITITVLLAWLVSAKILKIDAENLGIKLKTINLPLIILAILLPLLILAFYATLIPGKPYIAKEGKLLDSLIYGLFSIGLPAGICEELIFRGMIFRYMKKTLGQNAAIIIPAVLFACLHILNMQTFNLLDLLLLILAGSSVAVMFTFFALKSASIWPGALAHTLWNFLIIGNVFGIGEIVNGMPNNSFIIIPVESASKLLTGGNFGVEAALPAIIGYILVSICIYLTGIDFSSKNKNSHL